MKFLENHIEALIFCASEPVKFEDLHSALCEMFDTVIPKEDVQTVLDSLLQKYENENYAFQVFRVGGGYLFQTKPAFQASIAIFLKQKSKKRLSKSVLETLAIIAYKQPITKAMIEQIRGVNCDYAVQKLLEKELVFVQGTADTPGRPMLYATSEKFMEYFGINDLAELPIPKETMLTIPKQENNSEETS